MRIPIDEAGLGRWLSRAGSAKRAGHWPPTRSSIARSSGSTNTSGSFSTRSASWYSTTACATTRAWRRSRGSGFFAGKAAPAYQLAKLIIEFINNVAGTIDGDQAVRGRLKVVFLPDYCVTTAEHLIPASDVSNQISTAGYEAPGTSNMQFMMNGALTLGTRDGATIEMAEEAGEENFFLFGLTAEQVEDSRGVVQPALALSERAGDALGPRPDRVRPFQPQRAGIFAPLLDVLLASGDHYIHLADLRAYLEADRRLVALYGDPDAWARKAILNVAGSGKFSSDRAIAEYATGIWGAEPCPVPSRLRGETTWGNLPHRRRGRYHADHAARGTGMAQAPGRHGGEMPPSRNPDLFVRIDSIYVGLEPAPWWEPADGVPFDY